MKNLIALSIFFMLFSLTSCELIGDIFAAGFYTAIFIIILIVAIIIFIASKLRGKK